MDIRKVKKLIELLEGSKVNEIEIHEGEESVRIRRECHPPPAVAHQVSVQRAAAPAAALSGAAAPPADPDPDPELEAELPGHIITSPMVGTFYQSSAPGARPFVDVGESIEIGDTICIIEAMKILNQIESDTAGVLSAVLSENGQPVEYGQPLFVIDTDAG